MGELSKNEYDELNSNNINSKSKFIPFPVKIESLKDEYIIDIKCGWGHVLVLTLNGDVFSFGSNIHGQCGVNSKE